MSTVAKPLVNRRIGAVLGVTSVVFILSKATAFFAPMLLAKNLVAADYGTIELALAWATPCAIVAGLGLHASVPYFILRLNRPDSKRVFYLHVAGCCALLGLLAELAHLLPLPSAVAFALVVTAIFCAQNVYAAMLKTYGRPASASFTEVAVYCVLFVYAGALVLLHIPLRLNETFLVLLATTGTFAAFSAWQFCRESVTSGLLSTFLECFEYGRPIILSSMLGVLLMSGGRILIGALLGVKDVAVFSLLYRMAAAAVLVHQLSTTVIFAKIYKLEPKRLNYLLGGIQALVLVASLSIIGVGRYVGPMLFPLLRGDSRTVHQVLVAIAIQMFYWAASAQCEMIFYRENLSWLYAKWLGAIFIALIASSYLLKFLGQASLISLANLQMSITFLACLGGLLLLWKRGMRLPIPILLCALVFCGFWIELTVVTSMHR